MFWPSKRGNPSSAFAMKNGVDQPLHPRSLISAFVIRIMQVSYLNLLQSKVSLVAEHYYGSVSKMTLGAHGDA